MNPPRTGVEVVYPAASLMSTGSRMRVIGPIGGARSRACSQRPAKTGSARRVVVDPGSEGQHAPAVSAAPASAAPASASAATAETYEIKVASGAPGSYLTGKDGKTLYVFKNDTAGKSTCSGDCAATWPPFTVESKDQLKPDSGVTGTLDVVARDDGTMQVTDKGAPLYYYSGDTKAGDTKGQGLFGKWFVANP
jgi:predicted lipoprotein with Yx(FWY)xxD motif